MHVDTMLKILEDRTGLNHCLVPTGQSARTTFYSGLRSPDKHGATHGTIVTDADDRIVGTLDGADEYLASVLGCPSDKRSVVRALRDAALPCERGVLDALGRYCGPASKSDMGR